MDLEGLFEKLKEAREKAGKWKGAVEKITGEIRVAAGGKGYNPMARLMAHVALGGVVDPESLKDILLPEDIQITLRRAMDEGKVAWTHDWKIKIKDGMKE